MGTPFKLSQDNIELQFATNHLGNSFFSIESLVKTLTGLVIVKCRSFSFNEPVAGHHEENVLQK